MPPHAPFGWLTLHSRRLALHPTAPTRSADPTSPNTCPSPPATAHHAPSGNDARVVSKGSVDHGHTAWCVVVGSTATMIPTFGLMTTVGIFHVYWKENQLKEWSNTTISWIISVYGFLAVLLCGPFGVLFDKYGPRWLMTPAATVYCVSFLGIAFSSQYWQLLLCFSTAGVSAGRSTPT